MACEHPKSVILNKGQSAKPWPFPANKTMFMHKLIILFCLIFLSELASTQNIYTALHLNDDREYKKARPTKIIEVNTFYNSSGKQVDRNVKIFDLAGMLLTEERFDESKNLKARLTRANDTANKLILTRIFERWTKAGYSKETAFYMYDGNHNLIGITDKDADDNIIRQTNFTINEKGHPTRLSLLDANGNLIGEELAVYMYNKNRVVTSVVSNDGRKLTTDTIKISFRNASLFPGDGEIYNANGDCTNWTTRNGDDTVTEFEEEYLYDAFGNCTEGRIYKVTVKGNGKRKREIDRLFKKQYTY
jgi:YD repeat-containing protein